MADFPLTYTNVAGASATVTPSSVEVELNSRTVRTTSISGRQQVRSFGTSYYVVTLNFPPLTEEDRAQVKAKLTALRGGVNTFTIATKNFTDKKGSSSASEGIASSAAIGATTVTMDNSNEFKPGEYIKFSNHTKAYQVISHSGTTLTIEPPLQTAITGSHTVESGSNFTMTCRLADDNISYTQGADGFSRIQFTAIEAV
tara:strand:+ start:219 stop:818 length:600 start_codon:yes stop_codon:yes gene_type:complete